MCAVALCSLLAFGVTSASAADPLSALPLPSGVDVTPEPVLPADDGCADLAADPSRFVLYGRSAVGRDPADGIAFLVGNERVVWLTPHGDAVAPGSAVPIVSGLKLPTLGSLRSTSWEVRLPAGYSLRQATQHRIDVLDENGEMQYQFLNAALTLSLGDGVIGVGDQGPALPGSVAPDSPAGSVRSRD